MNYCTRCGAPLTPDTKFCTRCGQPVQPVQPAQPARPVQPAQPAQPVRPVAAAAAAGPQAALDGLWAGSAPGEMVLRSWTVPNVTPRAATGKRSVSVPKKQPRPKKQQAAPAKQEKPAKKKRRGRFILYLILFLVACYFIGKYNLLG